MDEHGRKRFLWLGGLSVLVVALGFIIGVPLTRIGDQPEGAARYTLTITTELLERYRQPHGTYPSGIDQIDVLLAADIPAENVERLHKDPWGQSIIYRFPATDPLCKFELYSTGPNQRDEHGGGDDVALDFDGRRPGCDGSR